MAEGNFWIFLFVGISPSVFIDPKDKTVREGKGLSLFCAATGKPTPRIKWKKNGKTITSDYRIKIRLTETGSKLRIRDSVTEDSGIYHCVAKNHHGYSSSAKATVDVRGAGGVYEYLCLKRQCHAISRTVGQFMPQETVSRDFSHSWPIYASRDSVTQFLAQLANLCLKRQCHAISCTIVLLANHSDRN